MISEHLTVRLKLNVCISVVTACTDTKSTVEVFRKSISLKYFVTFQETLHKYWFNSDINVHINRSWGEKQLRLWANQMTRKSLRPSIKKITCLTLSPRTFRLLWMSFYMWSHCPLQKCLCSHRHTHTHWVDCIVVSTVLMCRVNIIKVENALIC